MDSSVFSSFLFRQQIQYTERETCVTIMNKFCVGILSRQILNNMPVGSFILEVNVRNPHKQMSI
jgi:hypothetical protein